jgi:hypothetical protein
LKQITQYLRDTLIKEGYLKLNNGRDKHVYISSITKKGTGKTYYICEQILFNYWYSNHIQSDDKYYNIYYKNRRSQEKFKKNELKKQQK